MRLRLLFIPLTLVTVFALAAACGGDSGPEDREGAADEIPQASGLVEADTSLTFEGQLYRLTGEVPGDLDDDGFTEVGVTSKVDIDFDGELTVFRREGENEAVYTFSPVVVEEEPTSFGQASGEATEDLPIDDGEPGEVIAEEPLGQAIDAGEGSVVGTASGDDVMIDSDEGRTIVHERPDEEPPEEEPSDVTVDAVDMVDAEEAVSSGLWLRWEPES